MPNPESALDEEAGKLLLEDYQEYYKVRWCERAIGAETDADAVLLEGETDDGDSCDAKGESSAR